MAFTYILRCADDSLYVGHTDDLASREKTRNYGHGSTYTAARRPVCMIYAEEYATIQKAIARERQLKGWNSAKKKALVSRDPAALKAFSRRRCQAGGSNEVVTWRHLLKGKDRIS